MQDLQYNPFFVMLLGMGTVFIGLVCLIYISKIMSYFIRSKQPVPAPAVSAPVVSAGPAPAAILNRPQFVAAVSAAIAMEMGTEPNGLRIHSIKPLVGAQADRSQFVAAVSAALAAQMDTDASGIRIHSIQKV